MADRFHITISSVNRILRRVTLFISNLSPQIITWPDENEKRRSEDHFRTNGFPNIIGAIDGSHIKIDKPDIDPESYRNRKGYYSIQVCEILLLYVKSCQYNNIIILSLWVTGKVEDGLEVYV